MTSAAARLRQCRAVRSHVAAHVGEDQLAVVVNVAAVAMSAAVVATNEVVVATNAAAVVGAEIGIEVGVQSKEPVKQVSS
jgi:hypothetical protein